MRNQIANGVANIDRRDIDRIATELEGIIAALERRLVEWDLTLSSTTHTPDFMLRAQTPGSVMCAGSVLLFGVIQSLRNSYGTKKPTASGKKSCEGRND